MKTKLLDYGSYCNFSYNSKCNSPMRVTEVHLSVDRGEKSSNEFRGHLWSARRFPFDVVDFTDRNYHYKSGATQIPLYAVLAPIPNHGRKLATKLSSTVSYLRFSEVLLSRMEHATGFISLSPLSLADRSDWQGLVASSHCLKAILTVVHS